MTSWHGTTFPNTAFSETNSPPGMPDFSKNCAYILLFVLELFHVRTSTGMTDFIGQTDHTGDIPVHSTMFEDTLTRRGLEMAAILPETFSFFLEWKSFYNDTD